MQTLLQILASLETLAKLVGPSVEPLVLAQLEALKIKYSQPWEVIMIDAAENLIKSYFGPQPSPTPAG